jgi:carbamoyltransferase
MYILGLNAYHGDSSACIYKDTTLLAATEEERIRRIKHWAGLPVEAIKFCLEDAGITLADIDIITVSRDPKAKFGKKLIRVAKNLSSFKNVKDRASNSLKITNIKADIANALGFNEGDIKAKIQYIEHHRSHIASAYFVSPFEECAVLSIDGMGDFTSTMRGTAKGNTIKIIDSVSYPHSIGIMYTAFTQYLGFPNYGDEYKVMGLSPYGKANMIEKVRQVVKSKPNGLFELEPKFFKHFKDGVAMSWEGGSPFIENVYSDYFEEVFGPARKKSDELEDYHWNLAASVQAFTEELIFNLCEDLYKKTGLKNLCITGGVAQNSVANGKILKNTSFEKLYVPPAGHDAGTAVGSALYYIHHQKQMPRPLYKNQAYTGIQFSNAQIEDILTERGIEFKSYSDEDLYDTVSDKLVAGGVIGWYQGRAEFGPRALGNRSILVDPSRADAKDLLNEKIKRRESFRPFAPSILKEYVADYFEQIDEVPFMEKVFDIKKEKHSVIPAVTHVNGTGRLQTVDFQDNPRYHSLISAFNKKSGIPLLLNTSFNENEPIVNTPEHALDCYLRTKMDMLVLGNIIVER